MKQVSVLITYQALIAAIGNTRYLFKRVNEFLVQSGQQPLFEVKLAGIEKTIRLNGGLFTIHADITIDEIEKTDLIIIPPMSGDMEKWVLSNKKYIPWITEQYKKGAEVASLCVGAFLLAETGLLDRRECSTHWLTANDFREKYPDVVLVDEKIITDHEGLYTSGGANSYWNLLIYLVEKLANHEAAVYASKYFEIEHDRNHQGQFRIFEGSRFHEDEAILETQQLIETQYPEKFTVAQLADLVNLSLRTFQRRFKEATHFTVSDYIQKVKIEAAKRFLESRQLTINEVMYAIGYNDPKAFRVTFKKETGLSPLMYRNKYS
ncbi:MAG TPA: helix-turn-helix domain-containing protein [Chitinophagaceae bacterium]|nr:helix-turn-helix domain-containing protein [Chitinophagaceae bacterium]